MSSSLDLGEGTPASAARELKQLQVQTEAVRVTLTRLQDEIVQAETHLDSTEVAQLLEANELLVVAALHAQSDAEIAAHALHEASRSAELDPLTQLPNRVLLLDRFAQAIASAKRHDTRLALLFLDLNNFKQINDTLGHAIGDQVLKQTAQSLTSSVRAVDTVSRHGGDEFLILLSDVSHAADAARVADKVIAALGAHSQFGDQTLCLTVSIGISLYPDDGEDAATLIDRADAAMYRAKRLGLGSFVFHSNESSDEPSLEISVAAPHNAIQHAMAMSEHERRHVQLREANSQLVLAALSAQALQAAAEKAQRRQAEIMAMVAHELRSPLTPIRIAASLLSRVHTDQALLSQVQTIIEAQVLRMSRLVSDLLDVSRSNSGKMLLDRRVVEMAGIIDAAINACRGAMDTRSQQFTIQMPVCALTVDGDPVRLAQILGNLLDNASKYTPEGGQIGLSVVVKDDTIVMTLSDSGIGISAEALPHIFEPFVRGPDAIAFNSVGLGIGLAVVHELVEAHGGSVVASSAGSGRGSQFMVTLPLHRAARDD